MKATTQELIELYSTMLRERSAMAQAIDRYYYGLNDHIEEIFKIILERLKAENE